MAELQTLAAALELAVLAKRTGLFLMKVKKADKEAAEIHKRVAELEQVLSSIEGILTARAERESDVPSPDDRNIEKRIARSVQACTVILKGIDTKIANFATVSINDDQDARNKTPVLLEQDAKSKTTSLLERFQFAFRQTNIHKLLANLDARISALHTELLLLQLSEQAYMNETLGSNHDQVVATLAKLDRRLKEGNDLLKRIFQERGRQSFSAGISPSQVDTGEDQDAFDSLREELHFAGDIHERLTSGYIPDNGSIRAQKRLEPEDDNEYFDMNARIPPPSILPPTPESEVAIDVDGPSILYASQPESDEEQTVVEVLEIMNRHIDVYIANSATERDRGKFNRAEELLQNAISYSRKREMHYGVPFERRHELQEEAAYLYQKQNRFAAAIRTVSELLLEDGGDDDRTARQNQLLASIYYDKYTSLTGSSEQAASDIARAERHALTAFNLRYKKIAAPARFGELENHHSCVEVLARILQARKKTVEADNYLALLSGQALSIHESHPRRNTFSQSSTADSEYVHISNHDCLIQAIKDGDAELIQTQLNEPDMDINRVCRNGKTPLMYAVEREDVAIIRKLLDTKVGADVNLANRKGMTALHRAAELGSHEIIICLLDHDADTEAKDKAGDTPLMKAAKRGQSTAIELLFDRGADIHTRSMQERSCLHSAIFQPDVATINIILDIAPDLRYAVDVAGMTALHHCAEEELYHQAKTLLEHRYASDVNAIDSCRRSALYFAASRPANTDKRKRMVQLLLDHGAKLDPGRLPPWYRDYDRLQAPRRSITRHDSVSTSESIGTVSSSGSRFSRIFSRQHHK